jgi:hypothetical protein
MDECAASDVGIANIQQPTHSSKMWMGLSCGQSWHKSLLLDPPRGVDLEPQVSGILSPGPALDCNEIGDTDCA